MSNDKVKRRNHPDVVMAHAQIGLTTILLVAILALLASLIFFHAEMSDRTFTMVNGTLVSLVALLTISWQYLFARQRPNTLPDNPNNTGGNHAPISTGGTMSVTHDESRTVPS